MSLLTERTDKVEELYQTAKEAIDKNLIETEARNKQIKEIQDRMENLAISIDKNVENFTNITKEVLAEKGLDIYITSKVNKAIKSLTKDFDDFNKKIYKSYSHWKPREKFIEYADEIIKKNVSNFEVPNHNMSLNFWYKKKYESDVLVFTNVGFDYNINNEKILEISPSQEVNSKNVSSWLYRSTPKLSEDFERKLASYEEINKILSEKVKDPEKLKKELISSLYTRLEALNSITAKDLLPSIFEQGKIRAAVKLEQIAQRFSQN